MCRVVSNLLALHRPSRLLPLPHASSPWQLGDAQIGATVWDERNVVDLATGGVRRAGLASGRDGRGGCAVEARAPGGYNAGLRLQRGGPVCVIKGGLARLQRPAVEAERARGIGLVELAGLSVGMAVVGGGRDWYSCAEADRYGSCNTAWERSPIEESAINMRSKHNTNKNAPPTHSATRLLEEFECRASQMHTLP